MMKFIRKKVFTFLGLMLISLVLISPAFVLAEEVAEEVVESVEIGTTVPSQVSADFSYSILSAQETLADPVSHSVALTVYLFDKNKNPLSNKSVVVYSSRGSVDAIEASSKLSSAKAQSIEASDFQRDKTDENGMVSFRVTSFIPGESTLEITADTIVKLPSQTVKFLPLPFPANVTLSIDLPFTTKEWVILSPDQVQEDRLSPLLKKSWQSVNPEGTKIEIPFELFVLFVLVVLSALIFIILNFVSLRRVHRIEKEETEVLKKIAASAGLCRLKQENGNKCPHCDNFIKRK